ncbi:hypothetical protein F5Y04DRAFT_78695 [Hypomontagnella monticulosa]|nr:hypothetical protein F5Y04DRAFT_78695 [Hypomontagnella monticulosa]
MNGNQSDWISTPSGLPSQGQAAGLHMGLGEKAFISTGMHNWQRMGVGAPSQAPEESPYPTPEKDARSFTSRGTTWLGQQLPGSAGMLPFTSLPQGLGLPATTSQIEDRRAPSTPRKQQKRGQSLHLQSLQGPSGATDRADRVNQVANVANTRAPQTPRPIANGSREAKLNDPDWTYGVEVWPASDEPGCNVVANHIFALQQQLGSKGIQYDFKIATPVEEPGLCRQYTLLPKDRFNDRIRLEFLQIFTASRAYNKKLPGYFYKMSVVFKDRDIISSDSYPAGIDGNPDEDGDTRSVRYSPVPPVHLLAYGGAEDATLMSPSPNSPSLTSPNLGPPTPPESLPTLAKADSTRASRLGPIPKPDHTVTKTRDGKYFCSYAGCTDEVKTFNRKCEWSKHMDKHTRPYRCTAPGCEKLAGFTYSGGLLRHEREVHNKHGGPKNPLHCPHGNCKRHEGKGFSRTENLNEHLRRVHTPNESTSSPAAPQSPEDEVEELESEPQEKTGEKRKADSDLRECVKRLERENAELRESKKELLEWKEAQTRQSIAMMRQLATMSDQITNLSRSVVGNNSSTA